MSVRLLALLGLLAASAVAAPAGRPDFKRWEAVEDSLQQMPPRLRGRWLRDRGIEDPMPRPATVGTDSGLSVVGRWSYGPATFVTVDAGASDTFAYLSRGSGVSLSRLQTTDSLRLELLADINCAALTGRLTVQGNRLYVGSAGLETYDITDPSRPSLIARFPFVAYDHFVDDTFLYAVSSDSFKVYSIANPASPRPLGGCRDSGYVLFKAGSHAYLGHQYGLYVLDVSDPAQPRRVATMGYDVVGIRVRDSFCYVSTYDSAFHVVNVANPAAPFPVGQLRGVEPGYLFTVATDDTLVYTPAFDIISTVNPAAPRRVGGVRTPGWSEGVAVTPDLRHALVADHYEGVRTYSVSNPSAPSLEHVAYKADAAQDICLDGSLAYVADFRAGLKVLDLTELSHMTELGGLDTTGQGSSHSVFARDSFAFLDWWVDYNLLSVDVSDPTAPAIVGGCEIVNHAEAMASRDTWLYVAQNYRFQVINVARPREPRVIGTVNLQGMSYSVALVGSLAYVANGTEGLQIVSLTNPSSPQVVGSIDFPNPTLGVTVRDTFAYVAAKHLRIVSVARPDAPYVLDTVALSVYGRSVAVADTVLYVGTALGGSGYVAAFSIADPIRPVLLSQLSMPSGVNRLALDGRLVYAACGDAGLLVVEAGSTGVADRPSHPGPVDRCRVIPTVTARWVTVRLSAPIGSIRVVNAVGQQFQNCSVEQVLGGDTRIDLGRLPPGVYYVLAEGSGRSTRYKVVKQ